MNLPAWRSPRDSSEAHRDGLTVSEGEVPGPDRAGQRLRVDVPYGSGWYGYLVRRMAERPANTAFFLRSLLTKG